MTFEATFRAFDAWLWAPTSPLPLAVFRIIFGVILVAEAARVLPYTTEVFSSEGILGPPPKATRFRVDVLSRFADRPSIVRGLFVVHLVACAALSVGFLTPLASFLVYVHFASRHARAEPLFHGGDGLAVYFSFLMTFTSAGSALSCDSRLGWSFFGVSTPPIGFRLMQCLVPFIYWRTLQWKLARKMWLDGSAVFRSYHNGYLARGWLPVSVVRIRAVSALAAWGTLGAEAALPFLFVWTDTRRLAVGLHAALQIAILFTYRIKAFQWLMLAAGILYLDEHDLRWALAHLVHLVS